MPFQHISRVWILIFYNILHYFKAQIHQIIKFWDPYVAKMAVLQLVDSLNLVSRVNPSDRKIVKFSHFDQFRFQPLYISNEFWNSLVISTGPPLGHSSSYFSRKWWFFKLVGNPGNSWNLAKRRKTKFTHFHTVFQI